MLGYFEIKWYFPFLMKCILFFTTNYFLFVPTNYITYVILFLYFYQDELIIKPCKPYTNVIII